MTDAAQRAVFLDRDGTVIVEKCYLSDPSGVELEKNAAAGLKKFMGAGYRLVMITNQSGIGRGYFGQKDFDDVNERVFELLLCEGVRIDAVYFCPHVPLDDCACRKPKPGLVLKAASDLGLHLTKCFVIGDKWSDVGLGQMINAKTCLVKTGHGLTSLSETSTMREGTIVADDLAEAASLLLAQPK